MLRVSKGRTIGRGKKVWQNKTQESESEKLGCISGCSAVRGCLLHTQEFHELIFKLLAI